MSNILKPKGGVLNAFKCLFITIVCVLAGVTSLYSAGEVTAWGYNSDGQLGDNTIIDKWEPVQTHNITDVIAIDGGGFHSAAVRSDGTVWSWGDGSDYQMGNASPADQHEPCSTWISDVTTVAAGFGHSLAVKSNGTVWAWGRGANGEIGNGQNSNQSTPVQTKDKDNNPLTNVIAVSSAGGFVSHALKSDSTVWGWGEGTNGQIGDGYAADRNSAWQVGTKSGNYLTGVIAIAGGNFHAIALKADSTVWAWGHNLYGECGDGSSTQRNEPVQVHGGEQGGTYLEDIIAIAAGPRYGLALASDSTVWGWGQNSCGSVGNNSDTTCREPVQVHGGEHGGSYLVNIIAIASSGNHSIAIESDSTVWAWGMNARGQLGDNTTDDKWVPVQVHNITGIELIGGGDQHSFGVGEVLTAVEFESFDAQSMDGYILLRWKLAVEVNNIKYLILKRSESNENYDLIAGLEASGSHFYQYKDNKVESGHWYWYKLGEVNIDNSVSWHGPIRVKYVGKETPRSIYLDAVPSVGKTNFSIKYGFTKSSFVSLKLYDVSGSLKSVLFEGNQKHGSYSRSLDLSDFSSGIYFLRLEAGNIYVSKKLEVL
ncbi:MAG: T9SS type A sorting domain-containing protein [Candidatus Cloacimonadota bacterium]|nr:MAG: T9SS type A sorting domain-containing protein [Candidatus Cloacimonadota bacterium]